LIFYFNGLLLTEIIKIFIIDTCKKHHKESDKMKITQQAQDGIISLAIAGRLDAVSAIEADKEFAKVLDAGNDRMVIDLSQLDYISSAGLRVLLVVAKRIQQKGGKVVLCALVPNVKEVFEISGFSSIFKIFDNDEDAKIFIKG
jgi:stage II sporulation protein AA (anti-sigma F factor antagonist)